MFNRFPDEELLVLPLSSGLSGSYGMACVAREETGRSDIYVVDNKATALALALMVQIASERRAQGASARKNSCRAGSAFLPRARLCAGGNAAIPRHGAAVFPRRRALSAQR